MIFPLFLNLVVYSVLTFKPSNLLQPSTYIWPLLCIIRTVNPHVRTLVHARLEYVLLTQLNAHYMDMTDFHHYWILSFCVYFNILKIIVTTHQRKICISPSPKKIPFIFILVIHRDRTRIHSVFACKNLATLRRRVVRLHLR